MSTMIRPIKYLVLGMAVLSSALCSASPGILVVQLRVQARGEGQDPNLFIANLVAEELDNEGQVTPIVWSMADPIFRAAVEDINFKGSVGAPTLNDAKRLGNVVRTPYILICSVVRRSGITLAEAQLFYNGKQIWKFPDQKDAKPIAKQFEQLEKDPENFGKDPKTGIRQSTMITEGQFQTENVLRSLARTWALQIGQGPLKALPKVPRIKPKEIEPGQQPVTPNDTPIAKKDSTAIRAQSDDLIKKGDFAGAISLLRDAVDIQPMDLDLRVALIRALVLNGMPDAAGEEAKRSAALMPEKVQLRLEAAKAYLRSGDIGSAQNELNEALAREPNNPDARLFAGNISMENRQFDSAIEHYSKANDTGDALYRRGLAKAMKNDIEGFNKDVEAYSKKVPGPDQSTLEDQYSLATSILDWRTKDFGDQMRSLIQRARVRPKEPEVIAALAKTNADAKLFLTILEKVVPPDNRKSTFDRRVLAVKLMVQSAREIQSFLKSLDEDMLSDASVDLGEALQTIEAIKAQEKG